MKVVIDSNRMHSEELRAFLSSSFENKAVITEYSTIESFQGNSFIAIDKSWTVLKDFSDQILVLKGNRSASLINPSVGQYDDRLIDKDQTESIRDFIHILEHARAGNKNIQNQLLQRSKKADSHMAEILENSANMWFDIEEFSNVFTKDELGRMRRKELWKQVTAEKFVEVVKHLSKKSFAAHPDKPEWPHHEYLVNHFLFRLSLTHCFYLMNLVSKGTSERKATCVRNDIVDINFITFSTYFNGFMSNDHLASHIHRRTRFFLKQLKAFVPDNYQDK